MNLYDGGGDVGDFSGSCDAVDDGDEPSRNMMLHRLPHLHHVGSRQLRIQSTLQYPSENHEQSLCKCSETFGTKKLTSECCIESTS